MTKISPSYLIGVVLLGQALLAALLIQQLQLADFNNTTVTVGTVVAAINSVLVLAAARQLLKDDYKTEIIQKQHHYLQCIDSLIKSARSQRHDFINHLQAVYGLIQTSHFSEAREYIQKLWKETRDVSGIIQLKWPEVSALLHRKIAQSAAQQTVMDLDLQTSLAMINMKPYHINVILGNLIDNALEAVIHLSPEERMVALSITEENEAFRMDISNTGPPPGEEVIERFFEPGYSTKGKGRGHGLSSVNETLSKYGGSVSFMSNPVTFRVSIPKSRK